MSCVVKMLQKLYLVTLLCSPMMTFVFSKPPGIFLKEVTPGKSCCELQTCHLIHPQWADLQVKLACSLCAFSKWWLRYSWKCVPCVLSSASDECEFWYIPYNLVFCADSSGWQTRFWRVLETNLHIKWPNPLLKMLKNFLAHTTQTWLWMVLHKTSQVSSECKQNPCCCDFSC